MKFLHGSVRIIELVEANIWPDCHHPVERARYEWDRELREAESHLLLKLSERVNWILSNLDLHDGVASEHISLYVAEREMQ